MFTYNSYSIGLLLEIIKLTFVCTYYNKTANSSHHLIYQSYSSSNQARVQSWYLLYASLMSPNPRELPTKHDYYNEAPLDSLYGSGQGEV